jgi:hypothetical protein
MLFRCDFRAAALYRIEGDFLQHEGGDDFRRILRIRRDVAVVQE